MKKSILIALSIALVVGAMSSCSKSSKGKMEGDWTIDNWSNSYSETSGGSTDTYSTTISGATITETSTSGGATITQTGTVNEATWKIGKDGTWSRLVNATFTGTNGGVSYTSTTVTTTSGNWDFLIGVGDDYKKKERVAFYTLSESNTYTYTSGGITTTSNSSDTYKDGENSMVYVISESKKKSLIMAAEAGGTSTNGSTTTTTETDSYTLSQD